MVYTVGRIKEADHVESVEADVESNAGREAIVDTRRGYERIGVLEGFAEVRSAGVHFEDCAGLW
jgi:hypothetical protein